jgi:hypothetical protein
MPASAGMTNFDTVSLGEDKVKVSRARKAEPFPTLPFLFLCLLPHAFNLDLFSPPVHLIT